MLASLNMNLIVSSRQFGFGCNTKCQTAIFTDQEVIPSYTREISNVPCALIDLTKTFDQIKFDVLISKLQKMQVPPLITKLLSFMYNNYFVNVHVNGAIGDEWKIGNGALQGGILSPKLFNFYFSDVIQRTLELKARCKQDAKTYNIIVYVDDIALLAPSKIGLQLILGNCRGDKTCVSRVVIVVLKISTYLIISCSYNCKISLNLQSLTHLIQAIMKTTLQLVLQRTNSYKLNLNW